MADKSESVKLSVEKDEEKQAEGKECSSETKPEEDPELNDLLDSALADFDSPRTASGQAPASVSEKKSTDVDGGAAVAEGLPNPADIAALLGQGQGQDDAATDVIADEMAQQFEEAMKAFMCQEPEMMQQINKLAETAGSAGDSDEAQKEFTETLAQTLTGLSENAESLQQQMSEEELASAFGNMGVGDGAGTGNEMFPMMQGMMRMLLSKDVLYPSMKEIADKYPKWFEDNKDKEDQSNLERYQKQHKLMSAICVEFEAEAATDTEEVKTQRFEKLMDLMQQMQELGQPPKDIVGEMAPGLEFDQNGLPKLPGISDQCTVM